MEIKEALEAVLVEAPAGKGFNDYAKAYAQRAIRDRMEGEALKDQIPYILSNLQHWKGERAKAVKQALKEYQG